MNQNNNHKLHNFFRYILPRLIGKIALYVFVIGYAIFMLYPLIWLGITSLKSNEEFYANKWGLPSDPLWGNYLEAWNIGQIGDYFLNSIFVTSVSVMSVILFGSLAAYIIARVQFKWNHFFLMFFLSGLVIPVPVILPSLFKLLEITRLLDTYGALIFPYIAFALPFTVFILHDFFKKLPRDLEEMAIIDGCSRFGIFWKIAFPLAKPAIATAIIYNSFLMWNEFLFALVFIKSKSLMTLPLGLMSFQGQYWVQYGVLASGLVIATIPVIIVYMVFGERIIAGMTAGAYQY